MKEGKDPREFRGASWWEGNDSAASGKPVEKQALGAAGRGNTVSGNPLDGKTTRFEISPVGSTTARGWYDESELPIRLTNTAIAADFPW